MARIQLLFADDGNRRVMASILPDSHTVLDGETVRDADLYLVDEAVFPQYRETLAARTRREHPVFCPVVLVRREQTAVSVNLENVDSGDSPLVVDDVVDAPVERQALSRTITNLLVRREQTETLRTNLDQRTAQLDEERTKYRTLVEQSASGIAVTRDRKFVFANDRLASILDRDRETLEGLPLADVVAPEDRDVVHTRHDERIAGEEPPSQYEIAVVTPDGQRKDIDLRASRIEYGGSPAVLVVFHDVTERKEREQEMRQFKNAVEHAGHGIVVTDPNGVIEHVNPAFEEITGYSRPEAVGLTPRIIKSGEHDQEFYERLWNTILDGEVWNTEIVNERKSGERFVAHQTIAPILSDDGDVEGFVGIQDEITDRRLREQQLDVFHRVLRHNLRNKGATIQGQTNLLGDALEEAEHLERLATIRRNVQSLLDISEKAQHVRKAIANTTDEQSTRELVGFLRATVDQFASAYPVATIDLDAEEESVYVDSRTMPALHELVENALKHSDSSTPHVELTVSTDDTTACVEVSDDGPGIPDQERRALETGSETPLQHGSGLGLWLAYWLVHYVGGDIDIRVDEGGTTVVVTLPFQSDGSQDTADTVATPVPDGDVDRSP